MAELAGIAVANLGWLAMLGGCWVLASSLGWTIRGWYDGHQDHTERAPATGHAAPDASTGPAIPVVAAPTGPVRSRPGGGHPDDLDLPLDGPPVVPGASDVDETARVLVEVIDHLAAGVLAADDDEEEVVVACEDRARGLLLTLPADQLVGSLMEELMCWARERADVLRAEADALTPAKVGRAQR